MPPTHAIPPHVRLRAWEREQRLATLGYDSYADYLHSSAWRAVRRRYREQHPWICNICGADENLHLHHRTYDRVGEERLDDLMPLCDGCHEMVHTLERRGDVDLDFDGVINTARAMRNRAESAERRAAVQQEQHDDRERLKASLEELPLGERIRRLQREARATRQTDALRSFRPLRFREDVSAERLLNYVRRAEHAVYRL